MSNDIHSVLNAINEASGALQREPEYKTSIQMLQTSLGEAQLHNQELELNIAKYKRTIDELQSKVRSLEVERDDAGFRELEAQDKLDALCNMVKSFTSNVEVVMPKPVEIKSSTDMIASAASESEHKGESVEVPTPIVGDSSNAPTTSTSVSTTNATLAKPVSSGQSDPLPTFTVPLTDAIPPIASMPSASTEESVGKPYKGKTYSQWGCDPNYHNVSLIDWIEGGGTNENYWH